MTETPLIVAVIQHYYPDWQPPAGRRDWEATRCPFHGDDRPSASVSLSKNAFRCHACGMKGDAISIIREREEVDYAKALEFAEKLSPGGHHKVSPRSTRQPRRRVFGLTGSGGSGGNEPIHAGVRGRSTPWS